MSGHGDARDGRSEADAAASADDEELTAVAEPAVIDLRDGVDTIAAHEADVARRAALAKGASRPA